MTELYGIPFTFRDLEEGCHAELFEKGSEGGVLTVGMRLTYDKPVVPKSMRLSFKIPNNNVLTVYTPFIGTRRLTRGVRPDWSPFAEESRLPCGMPLLSLIGHNEKNRATVALSDCKSPIRLACGVIEETAEVNFKLNFFTMSGGLVARYETEIRIDLREIPYTEALRDAEDYLFAVNAITPAHIPETAIRPMYSTWYSYHQAVESEALIAECRLAKAMGMEAIIVDDGWQTDDNNRGYAFCGDWEVTPTKIPDIHYLVDEIHKIGMKVIFWFAVPFVGASTKAYRDFKEMLLADDGRCAMIDPRYPEARRFLTDKYVEAVKDWGFDGLKLDFIDSYVLSDKDKLSDPRMDTISLFDALDLLMTEVRQRLQAIKPDVLLEFRQGYVGPFMQTYGNMFRVADCPQDCLTNRIAAIDMRLAMHRVAIHSDMLMWHNEESAEVVAHQLLNVFFIVPQISLNLAQLPERHTVMLRHYLALWNRCRDTLLFGSFLPEGVDGSYTMLHIDGEGEHFCFAFSKNICAYDGKKPLYYLNVTCGEVLYLELSEEKAVKIYDCTGECVAEQTLSAGIHKLAVPMSGMVVAE